MGAQGEATGSATSDIAEKLRSYLETDSRIDMAFLFGSFAKGTSTQRSDVDVAIHVDTRCSFGIEDVIRASGELERLLRRDVDLIVLNKLRMQRRAEESAKRDR